MTIGWKMIIMSGSDSCPETIKRPSIGSPRTPGLRQTCRSTLCSDCSRRCSWRSRSLAFSGPLETACHRPRRSILAIPGYLVIAVIVYSILLSAATIFIARHLTRVMEENKRTEAELRSIGTHLRESGEGRALPDGKKDGRHAIGAALKAVIAIWRDLLLAARCG